MKKVNTVLSEHTVEMTPEEREKLRQEIIQMSDDELKEFRNSLDPDSMGFFGEEGAEE